MEAKRRSRCVSLCELRRLSVGLYDRARKSHVWNTTPAFGELVSMTIALALLTCVVVAEVVLRFLPVASGLRALPVDAQNPVARFTPNRRFVFSRGWSLSLVNHGRTNNAGFVNDQDYDPSQNAPLLAVIGDDYVEAAMVPYESTLQGRLARALAGQARVYSFGASGAQLSQYLAWADYVRETFCPTSLVVVVTPNDADQSLLKYWKDEGFYHFRESEGGALVLERVDYRPSRLRQALRQSALARYVLMNGPGLFAGRVGAVSGSTPPDPGQTRLRDSQRAVDAFCAELPVRSGVPPQRTVLVVDALRPAVYDARSREAAALTFPGRVRRYLVERGRAAGFEVVDLEPIFASHFARTHRRFEHANEAHWSALGHGIVAEAVAGSVVFKEMQSLADAPSAR